ncbi:nicotinate phosphoribosyltransferase [Anaeromyxobacter terrae]|uniref:nicotinate phosphoribosyltransferase n=1 Tax=Anaeromyxobacter terrae TaxID=2925406 RepID=UPI001F56520C|nr:nicotinate phosphoribosyltransferase [Anaeromyxobacter sp. SG22]
MPVPSQLYRPSLALLTDFYELTMAYAAWKSGLERKEACFTLSFRKNPFAGGFTVAAGLEHVVDFVEHLRFDADDLAFLADQRGVDGEPLFERGFLEALARLEVDVDVDAVPEGTVVFPYEPLLRVAGPIVPAMILETALLAMVNFQSLVATKAARVCIAARGEPVLEFGLRRAQGIDGGLSASRAAYIGGCSSTSNTLAGRLYGIPVRGTHAHSWVMLYGDEREAFMAYARALPANCVFLVDTYGTLSGIDHAIEAGRWLRTQGKEMVGIRLDSGDLAWLSIEARKKLDEAGFPKAVILASNELDENIIQSLKDQGATIAVWGVGTRLVTGMGDGALGGVYKLGAVRDGPAGPWLPRVKVSEQTAKTNVPGVLQIRRFLRGGEFLADAVYEEGLGLPVPAVILDPLDPLRRREIEADVAGEDLLVPVFRRGRRVYDPPPLTELRARTVAQLGRFHAGVKRFVNPHQFPVGLERGLHELRARLVLEARAAPR